MRRTAWLVAIAVALSVATPAVAGEDDDVARLEETIHELVEKGEAMNREGRHEAARECFAKAEMLEGKLRALRERHEGHDGRGEEGDLDRVRRALDGLEHGIHALESLGLREEAEHLEKIFRDVRKRLEHAERERGEKHGKNEAGEKHFHALELAMHALMEKEERDLADQVERFLHAYRVRLEGRKDEEALEIRARAPKPGQLAEILQYAAKLWREFERPEKAEAVEAMAREFAGKGEKPRGDREREVAKEHLKILRIAMHGLMEAERRDGAEVVEHAIHALELALEDRRDEKAMKIRKSAPRGERMADLLRAASGIWREFEREEKAAACAELARHYYEMAMRGRDAPVRRWGHVHDSDEEPGGGEARRRVDELKHRLGEVMEEIEKLKRELEGIRRGMK